MVCTSSPLKRYQNDSDIETREKRSFNLLNFAITENKNTRLEGTKQNTMNNNTVIVTNGCTPTDRKVQLVTTI